MNNQGGFPNIEDMERESAGIKRPRQRTYLMAKDHADEEAGLLETSSSAATLTLPLRIKDEDVMIFEKLCYMKNSATYKGGNQVGGHTLSIKVVDEQGHENARKQNFIAADMVDINFILGLP